MSQERATEIKEREEEILEKKRREARAKELKVFRKGVGKYLNIPNKSEKTPEIKNQEPPAKKKKDATYQFQNFNSW